MTEQETQALLTRLTHAWGVKDAGTAPRCTFENADFRFECELAPHIHLRVLGRSNTARASMIQWQRCELVHNEGKLKRYTPISADAGEWRGIEEFIALWWPRFQRGCFLSGLSLQHSAREEKQWLTWYHEQTGSDKHLAFTSRRVCAAFGLKTFELKLGLDWVDGQGTAGSQLVSWKMRASTGDLVVLHCGKWGSDFSGFEKGDGTWQYHVSSIPLPHQERTARALYCLGVEDEQVRAQLPELSAHEKLEHRLSLSREFWPKRWLEESAAK